MLFSKREKPYRDNTGDERYRDFSYSVDCYCDFSPSVTIITVFCPRAGPLLQLCPGSKNGDQ